MFTASGLRVRFLKVSTCIGNLSLGIFLYMAYGKADVRLAATIYISFAYYSGVDHEQVWEKSGYNTVEWVRYITRAGSYEIRCWDFILSRFWRIVDANRVFLARKSMRFPSHCYNGHTWGSSFLDRCMSHLDSNLQGSVPWTIWFFSSLVFLPQLIFTCPRLGY